MNCEELLKHPPTKLPLLFHHLPSRTMTTLLDTHLALIRLARSEAQWTAKEDSDWTSLILFLTTKLPPANPAVPIDALRHSLSKAVTEIAAATAALNSTAPPVHAQWPPPGAHSDHIESPPRHTHTSTQGISPSPKKTKVTPLPVKLNKHAMLRTPQRSSAQTSTL